MGELTSSEVGFRQSKVYECVLYRGKSIYILYTDNYIQTGIYEEELSKIVADIKDSGLDITKEGDIEDFPEAKKR